MTAPRALLLACALACAACGDANYRGKWEVVGYRRPTVSMLGELEAQTRLGDTLVVTKSTATLGPDTCAIEKAARQTLTVRNLEMAYDLTRGELGLPQESVELLDITCSEGQLEYGQQLIRVGADSLMAPWDGIFLILEKRRS
jgi:hypothetical protein